MTYNVFSGTLSLTQSINLEKQRWQSTAPLCSALLRPLESGYLVSFEILKNRTS